MSTPIQHTMVLARKSHMLARKHVRKIPRQIVPKTIERTYYKSMVFVIYALRKAYMSGSSFAQSRSTAHDMVHEHDIEQAALKVAHQVAYYQRVQLTRQIIAALGFEVLISDRRLAAQTANFVRANVTLIKSVIDQFAQRVETKYYLAIQQGKVFAGLERELRIASDRLKLITGDQVTKFYGELNATRQQDMGITKFVWRTMLDDRVRPSHEELEGRIFAYNSPPDIGLPGEPINCRCYAEPIFTESENQ